MMVQTTNIDAQKYPSAAAYLGGLPAGFDSFADCAVQAEALQELRKEFPELVKDSSLPAPIRGFLDGSSRNAWVSEVASNVLLHMVRDVHFASDEDFMSWAYENSRKVFRSPLYRALMFVMSPTLVVMGASKRWVTFHKGSTLSAKPVSQTGNQYSTVVTLDFPAGLFSELTLQRQGAAFKAALIGTTAANLTMSTEPQGSESCNFVARWSK